MSLKTLLLPLLTERLLSHDRLLAQRARAERSRRARGEPHSVHYFHQVDDPYSALAASALIRLRERYEIELVAHVVGPPPSAAAPDRDRLVAYSRQDAQRLAGHWSLEFRDPGVQPSREAVARATGRLVAAIGAGRFVEEAWPLSRALWTDATRSGEIDAPLPTNADVTSHLRASESLRRRLGHYLGAMFHYAGEWYWGLDRLYHLECRLQALGAQKSDVHDLMFPPSGDLTAPVSLAAPPPIDFYFSLRSPYSAIVMPRVFALGRLTGAPVRLCFVLPMVMRGLPVPWNKRLYIVRDAAREAYARSVPFGRLNDPVGRPTERGLSLIPHAEREGRAQEYLLSFMRGVWAEGLDAGSDGGLRTIVERAGLSWERAQIALHDTAWRAAAEAHRRELLALGLWGVPSFHVRGTSVWGQDRLWAIEDELLGRASAPTISTP
ncbi:MAG: DsbA family protein [Polyangiales bacterium]